MTTEFEGYRDRLPGGCGDCAAYTEVVTPVGQETTITIFHDATCPATDQSWVVVPGQHTKHGTKPEVVPYWPEQ